MTILDRMLFASFVRAYVICLVSTLSLYIIVDLFTNIDDFLKLCDDPANYPILIHCMAGLHRTGALTAVYRMEYEGWSVADAMRELRANGYGDRKATTANDYIYEYLYLYQPRSRSQESGVRSQKDRPALRRLTPDP